MEIRMTTYHAGQSGVETVSLTPAQFIELPAGDASGTGGVVWFDFRGPMDKAIAARLIDGWDLHALAVHAVTDLSGIVRLQEYATHVALALTVIATDTADTAGVRRIGLLLGRGYLMTYHEGDERVIADVSDRIGDRIPQKSGSAYLLYELLDCLLEDYFEAIERISERIDDLDSRLTERDDSKTQARLQEEILSIKRQLLVLNRALTPLRDSLQSIRHTDGGLISDSDRAYLGHASNQVLSILESVISDREILTGAAELLMSTATKRMNEVMTFLTVFTTLFIPINFIASFYGMNLMIPEFGMHNAYPVVIGVMVAIVAGMFLWFRRRGWL